MEIFIPFKKFKIIVRFKSLMIDRKQKLEQTGRWLDSSLSI